MFFGGRLCRSNCGLRFIRRFGVQAICAMAHILSDNCFEYSKRRLVRACQLLNIYVACARQECVNRFWIRFGLVPDFALLPCVWKPLPNELKLLVLWVFFGGRSCSSNCGLRFIRRFGVQAICAMAHILSGNCFEYSKRRLARACQLLNIYVACARQECVDRFWIRFGLAPKSPSIG